jgi:hypothetical protein
MAFRMTSSTQADKVARLKRKLRILIVMLDVMHCRCLRQPAVSLAVNAKETITTQHSSAHRLPCSCLAELLLRHAITSTDNGERKGLRRGL